MFCRIRVSFENSKVSVLENRGHLLDEKVSGKGSLLILENDHTSYLLHLSGGTGVLDILYTYVVVSTAL